MKVKSHATSREKTGSMEERGQMKKWVRKEWEPGSLFKSNSTARSWSFKSSILLFHISISKNGHNGSGRSVFTKEYQAREYEGEESLASVVN